MAAALPEAEWRAATRRAVTRAQATHGSSAEAAAHHVFALGDPYHRFDAQRMPREKRGAERAGPKRAGEPTQEDYDDVATNVGALVADTSGGETEAAAEAAGVATGENAAAAYRFEATCKDAAGQAQSDCGELTDEAHLAVHWEGEVDATTAEGRTKSPCGSSAGPGLASSSQRSPTSR